MSAPVAASAVWSGSRAGLSSRARRGRSSSSRGRRGRSSSRRGRSSSRRGRSSSSWRRERSSREERDLVESYRLGANAYVVKPVDFEKFTEAVRELGMFWALINEAPPRGAAVKV